MSDPNNPQPIPIVEIVDGIPKSETGEILRGALRAWESAKLRGQS